MGARQSHLNIILEFTDYKRNQHLEDKGVYTIEACKGLYTKCNDFEVVTYNINHQGDGTNYDIYIYNSKDSYYNDDYVFAYCSPAKNQVASRVEVYYSVLSPQPLVITFVTKNGNTYNCPFDRLKSVGWDWASNITEYYKNDLQVLLKNEYQKLSWDKTIKFTSGNENQYVKVQRQEIDDYRYYRVILLPEEIDSILGSECLLSFNFENFKVKCDKSHTGSNKLDSYYLGSLFNRFYPGIILYFARKTPKPKLKPNEGKANEDKDYENTLLLVEFIHSCETISLKRKDKDCCWWDEEQVKYDKYGDLFGKLETIRTAAESTVIKTIFLDRASANICHKGVKHDDKPVYNKYTYEFDQKSKTVLLFERKTITIGPIKNQEFEAKNVDVYYLKTKTVEDKQPFLISLYEQDSKLLKVYHFKYGAGFDEWEELSDVSKLPTKLEEINKNITCSLVIDILRKMVYDILKLEKPAAPPPAPPKEDEKRPPTIDPDTRPDGLSLLLIIGGSVGGVVLIVGLAIGYGVYWYNTTIKLLT